MKITSRFCPLLGMAGMGSRAYDKSRARFEPEVGMNETNWKPSAGLPHKGDTRPLWVWCFRVHFLECIAIGAAHTTCKGCY